MFADRLVFPSFVLAKSGAGMSVCLANIASVTAWTSNFINYTTSDFNWDFCLKSTYKCSDFPDGDDWNNWSLNLEQRFHKLVGDGASILDFEEVLGGGWFCGDARVWCCFLFVCF